jgi:hypothetical protein
VCVQTDHLLQECPAEDYKLNNDEHRTHLKFYDYRYNSAVCLHVFKDNPVSFTLSWLSFKYAEKYFFMYKLIIFL